MSDPTATVTENPPPSTAQESPLRSQHTDSFARLLEHAGISLLVSTYQAGRLIMLRAVDGVINTHFRVFDVPMGMAIKPHRLAVSTRYMVWELGDYPQLGASLPSELGGRTHDACFLPTRGHVTGDIRTHEMGYAGDDLWLVNTRFSCLCTLEPDSSFVPRWKPPFVTALSNEDRCHLNGMAILNGRPRLVTALGQTDSPEQWRANKFEGGLLMDINNNSILAKGLSMPHSPRFYDNRTWFMESGKGTLSFLNGDGSRPTMLTELPGFTRGLDFWGRFAFIGLSQVREKYFSGLPITDRLKPEERKCGVWVVDIYTGQIVAFLEFLAGVQEIFDVKVLHGIRFPEAIDFSMPQIASAYVLPQEVMPQIAPPRPSPYAEQDAKDFADRKQADSTNASQ